jgi:hypothetical protein
MKRMRQKDGCIKTLVHVGSTSSSARALQFYDVIRNIDSTVMVLYGTWNDVPHDKYSTHRMHIDASVFSGTTCTRLEIDGEIHFKHSGTTRSDVDENKGFVLCKHRVGMVRLHYRDVDKSKG